jgi:phosphohistidine phosphatase SixA
MNKSLFCIRNAHNFSSKITPLGFQQINNLKQTWKDLPYIQLVVMDTDKKSYTTAKSIFTTTPLISLNILHSPKFHLSNIDTDEDIQFMFTKSYLFDKDYNDRVKMFYTFLERRNENTIAYVGHNSFINNMTAYSYKQPLERCRPYLHELTFNSLCDN